VYISFVRSSQCLTAPEIYKALNPKSGIKFDSSCYNYSFSFRFYQKQIGFIRGYNSVGTGYARLLMSCNYSSIVGEFTATEKSPFEGGRGMTNGNYETISPIIAVAKNSPLERG